MKVGKPKSKRVTVRLRHKIEKASLAKQRKDRKQAKKDPQWRSKIKKDPGIPNLFPYKDRILEQIEERKLQKEQEVQAKRAEAWAARKDATENKEVLEDAAELSSGASLLDDEEESMEVDGDASNPMAALLASARARAVEYDEQSDASDEGNEDGENDMVLTDSRAEHSARSYAHLFETVLSSADIVIYVLDARDPPSTRSVSIERQIAASSGGSKRLLLVLNKIDLVPPQVLKDWLTYLRRYHPTLPLRASAPASNAKVFDHKSLTQKATSETLLRALKAYATEQNFKRAITVGVVGYPNVGKSSVINALAACLGRRSQPAPTGAEAGVTTALKSIKLDGKVTLLDSPGVVFPDGASEGDAKVDGARPPKESAQARLVLLNALPPKAIADPVPAISLLLTRQSADPATLAGLLDYYGLPELMSTLGGDRTTDFLVHVARKRGRLGRGGVPNLESAAMCVLQDWRDGRIAGWVEPPSAVGNGSSGRVARAAGGMAKDEKQIVSEWAEEFKIEGLWDPGRYEKVEDVMEA